MRPQALKVKTPNLLVPLIRLALVPPPAVPRPQTTRFNEAYEQCSDFLQLALEARYGNRSSQD
jgi:hypothetical protein